MRDCRIWKNFLGNMKLHRKDLNFMFVFMLIFFGLGVLILSIALGLDKDTTSWVAVGTIIAIVALIGFAILNFFSYRQEFILALTMGNTRREFMIVFAMRQLVWMVIGYITLLVFMAVERFFYQTIFSDKVEAFSLGFLTDWRIVVPILFGSVLLTMFLGTLYSRFGKVFCVILYFGFLTLCLLVPRVISYFGEASFWEKGTLDYVVGIIIQVLFAIPIVGWCLIGGTVAGVMIWTVIRLGMKQMVF